MARDTSGGEPFPGNTAFLVCPKGMCQAEDLEQEDYEGGEDFGSQGMLLFAEGN